MNSNLLKIALCAALFAVSSANATNKNPPKTPEPPVSNKHVQWWTDVKNTNTNSANSTSKADANASSKSDANAAANAIGTGGAVKNSGNSSATGGKSSSVATGGAGGSVKDSGNSTATSVAVGGEGGKGGAGGNATAKGGHATQGQGQEQGQTQGITKSGNSSLENVGNAQGGKATSTNSLGQGQSNDHSGNSSNVNTTASLSNSGGNTLSNGSESASSVGDVSSASRSSVGDTSLTGGNQTTALRGGDQVSDASNSGGNSTVSVDAADRSTTNYESQDLFLPSIHTAAPALVAGPALAVDRGVCGPRMDKRQERVNGTYVGIMKRSTIDLGVDDELVPASEPYRYWTAPNGATHVFGHQIVTFASVNGVAASRSIGVGGGKTGGDWGQAGVSSGSSVQRTILRVQLQECELQVAPRPVLVEVKKIRE